MALLAKQQRGDRRIDAAGEADDDHALPGPSVAARVRASATPR
jgi:hypothetical protein